MASSLSDEEFQRMQVNTTLVRCLIIFFHICQIQCFCVIPMVKIRISLACKVIAMLQINQIYFSYTSEVTVADTKELDEVRKVEKL